MNLVALTLSTLLLQASDSSVDDGPKAQVLAAIKATLPGNLVATKLTFVGRSQWSSKAMIIVSWDRGMQEGLRMATVNVLDGGQSFKTWASTRLVGLRPVLVMDRDMKAGATIGAGGVRTELRPVRAGQGLDLTPEALAGQNILVDIKAGAVISPKDVALPARLPAGANVRVISEIAGVRIRVKGNLVSSARPGALAKVRISSSSRVLSGRLIDAETFVVEASK